MKTNIITKIPQLEEELCKSLHLVPPLYLLGVIHLKNFFFYQNNSEIAFLLYSGTRNFFKGFYFYVVFSLLFIFWSPNLNEDVIKEMTEIITGWLDSLESLLIPGMFHLMKVIKLFSFNFNFTILFAFVFITSFALIKKNLLFFFRSFLFALCNLFLNN